MPRILSFALGLVVSCGRAPERDAPASFSIATWNAERVFDSVCDTGRCGPSEAEDVRTVAEAGADAIRVARALRTLDADVVVLEEIENRAMLDRIVAAGGTYERACIGESGPGTIDVAIVSRFPLIEVFERRPVLDIEGREVRSTRVMLEAHFDAGGMRLVVIGAHFKSRFRDDAERRHAEARAAGELVRRAARKHPDALIVLAGDLNDTPDSPTLEILEGDFALALLTRSLPDMDAYSFGSGSRRTLIDHVLMAPSAFVSDFAIEVVRGEGDAFGGSDHAAIRATIDVE
jgi:endonuclease/exonuclease/phosphatase family metal-dependent hydrolase